jgi:hypothetical protein
MSAYQSRPATVHPTRLQASLIGTILTLFSVLSVAWLFGQPPTTAYASGVPYCGKLAEEHAPTRPASHLDRSEGPVGADVTVTASGWRPGAHVTLHVDGRAPKTGKFYTLMPTFAQGVVAHDGTVRLGILDAPKFFCVDMNTYPNTEYRFGDPGSTAFFVLAADDGEVSAPVAFRYLAAPTTSLSAGEQGAVVGTSVVVTGSGWEPYAAVTAMLTSIGISSHRISYGETVHATADNQGAFQVSYPIAAGWPWHTQSQMLVKGSGPRFGTLEAVEDLGLRPAVLPTFQVNHTLVTPGMTLTVSGEHWYPGDTYTIKYCDAQWQDGGWTNGPNCGKAVNPALGTVTVDATGRMHQQFSIPNDQPPGVIMVRILELTSGINVQPIAVHVVDHLPTWDDIHPRVAALRNTLVGSLPFTIPAALLLGALAVVVGVHRWRANWRARHSGG